MSHLQYVQGNQLLQRLLLEVYIRLNSTLQLTSKDSEGYPKSLTQLINCQ